MRSYSLYFLWKRTLTPRFTVTGITPRLMTVCTLTGHAVLSVGPYAITLDNGVAKKDGQSLALQRHGEVWGDPLEVGSCPSSVRVGKLMRFFPDHYSPPRGCRVCRS